MTTKTTTQSATSYAEAYAALADVAQRLKGPSTAASLDTLAQDVALARRMFGIARSRLDAIRAEIDAELASETVSAKA